MTRRILCVLLLAACSADKAPTAPEPSRTPGPAAPPVAPPPPTRFTVTGTGIAGSGSYAPGDTVHVAALFDATALVAGPWSGDPLVAANADWSARFIMPSRPVVLAVGTVPVAASLTVATSAGATARPKTYRYTAPPAPRGVVLMLHGTTGSSKIVESGEGYAIALEAVAAGYAVLAPESEETVAGDLDGDGKIRWDIILSPSNTDFANLDALITTLRQRGIISASMPLYAMGMSNGSSMVVSLGAIASIPSLATRFPALRFRSVAGYCAAATANAVSATQTPTAWYLCRNDSNENVGADGNARAASQSASLAGRGIATDLAYNEPSPLFPDRFARSSLISPTVSRNIVAELRTAGVMDMRGFLNRPPADIRAMVETAGGTRFPVIASLAPAAQGDVREALDETYAEHQLFSDQAKRMLRFFSRF